MRSTSRIATRQTSGTEPYSPVPASASSAAPYAEPSCVSSVTTRLPRMSASNWRQKGLRAPPPDARTELDRHAEIFDDIEAIALAVRYAFDHGADQIGARVPGSQADPAAARCGVQMRSALTHQIGQPEQALRAGRRGCGLGGQRIVVRAGRQLIAEPLQAETRALRDAHHMPLAAHRVAERVHAAGWIVGDFSMCAKTTPEVPSVQETMPGSTMPLPTALAA